MTVFAESGIDQRLQHLQKYLLYQSIRDRRDAQLALATVGLWKHELIPIRIKNDNCVASPCRAAALPAASRLVLFSNANWNYNHDSGRLKGRRCISGGRAALRTALYIATLAATRFNPAIREFYQRLLTVGKVKKVALVACMRKLLTLLNAIVKSGTPWNEKMNAMEVENA